MVNIKSFIKQMIRVWHLMKKPSRQEWTTIAKVSAIGLGLIGLIGFIVAIIMGFIPI
jgi:protein transport protein SEC61 subunit gamma and related proteins